MDVDRVTFGESGQASAIFGVPVRIGHGIPEKTVIRFSGRIKRVKGSGCWEWTAGQDGKGYGSIEASVAPTSHRFSYHLFVAPIPKGYHVHHECENTLCANPAHLKALTPRSHSVDHTPTSPGYINSRKTHCIRGHELSGYNLIVDKDNKRHCRECSNYTARANREIERQARPPKTECRRGHAWIEANWTIFNGKKQCRLCKEITLSNFKEKAKATGHTSTPRPEQRKSTCKRGHPMSGDNLYVFNGNNYCRACRNDTVQRYKKRKRLSLVA
jgi:hypothetical protein